jgi:probable phosphoglycerate mutase
VDRGARRGFQSQGHLAVNNSADSRTYAREAAPRDRRRLLLVRHGHVDYFTPSGAPLNPRDAPLSGRGRDEVDALADALVDTPIDVALTSPLPRTRETATRILQGRATPLIEDEGFAEIRPGRLREIPVAAREAEIAYPYDRAGDPAARFIGGEIWGDFRVRVVAALDRLLVRPGWSSALISSHDAVNRVILAWALDSPGAERAVEQDPACLNVIDIDGLAGDAIRRKLIRAQNVTVHDPAKRAIAWTWMESVYRAWRPER